MQTMRATHASIVNVSKMCEAQCKYFAACIVHRQTAHGAPICVNALSRVRHESLMHRDRDIFFDIFETSFDRATAAAKRLGRPVAVRYAKIRWSLLHHPFWRFFMP